MTARDDAKPVLRRVLGNAGLLLGGRTANAVMGLGYMAIAARALGVRELGVLVLIHAFAQFLGDVVKFQSWQTVLQYGAAPLAEGRAADFGRVVRFTLALDLISGAVAAVVGVTVALAFSRALGWSPADAPAAALYALSTIAMVAATPVGLLRLFDRFDVMAGQAALTSLVRLAGSGVAVGLGWSLHGFLLVWALGTVAGFAWLVMAAHGELGRRALLADWPRGGPLAAGLPGAWRFAWTTNLGATLDTAFTHAVTLLVGAQLGPAPAALWRVGRQVADALAKPARLLIPALYPELARLRASSGEAAMWRLATQVALLCGAAGLVILAVAAVAGAPLLGLIMGPGFAAAAPSMVWQVGAAVVAVFALPLEPLLVSLGRPGAALRVRVVVSAAFLAALPFLTQRFGVQGAGAALVCAAAAMAAGMLILLLRGRSREAATAAPLPSSSKRLKSAP